MYVAGLLLCVLVSTRPRKTTAKTRLEPTPEGIRRFLSTTDQNTSRVGVRPPTVIEERSIRFFFFGFGFCYIYLESLTLASASCRQTIVRGADCAIGIEPSL